MNVNQILETMAMNDERGCTLCKAPGTERYERFTLGFGRRAKKMIQYDYRHTDGELFSTVAPDLDACRSKRDNWLNHKS